MDTTTPQPTKPKRPRTSRKKADAAVAEAAPPPAAAPLPKVAMTPQQSAELDRLISELNGLADELKRAIPSYSPPPFSPQAMANLLKANLSKIVPENQLALLGDLKQNLEGTKPEDWLNPDTWKGMWYILNYSVQAQTDPLKQKLMERLAGLPGANIIFELSSSFEGAKPSDFLDINTWKGVAYILDHTLRSQAKEVKKKLLGGEDA